MKINGIDYRSVWWEEGRLMMIDQNQLPFHFATLGFTDYRQVAKAIVEMTVRGAPAIGATGAFAMALAAQSAPDEGFRHYLRSAFEELKATRPTAIDLINGLEEVYESTIKFIPNLAHARKVAILSAREFAERSVMECRQIGQMGLPLIKDGSRILTHCNAGALATVDWGTALAPLRAARQKQREIFVYVDETRPRLQGARLTAWELEQEGIPHAIIADSAAGYYFYKKEIDLVITGADRICLNGDIANKIGTYEKAVLAHAHGIPFYVAAPLSTFDFGCSKGEDIPIEIRSQSEVKQIGDCQLANPGSEALNPAFDITPARYITGIITPKGIFPAADAARLIQE
ncbi:MAG: S-methyl-5-thioribose-1-phosphate isomerase [Candidatus Cloacimonetes bacterium]|nr:S-methyl-5-thioribose-1-phosphate isomerase [Candidatus Cloacimonadota bacterium]